MLLRLHHLSNGKMLQFKTSWPFATGSGHAGGRKDSREKYDVG